MTRIRLALALIVAAQFGWPARGAGGQSLAVSGNPAMLTVSTALPGSGLAPALDQATFYTVTTTEPDQEIVARLDAALPSGVTLSVALAAPAGASTAGQIVLSTSDQRVVGGIPVPGTYAGLAISYRLAATVASGPIPVAQRTVTFTVIQTASLALQPPATLLRRAGRSPAPRPAPRWQ